MMTGVVQLVKDDSTIPGNLITFLDWSEVRIDNSCFLPKGSSLLDVGKNSFLEREQWSLRNTQLSQTVRQIRLVFENTLESVVSLELIEAFFTLNVGAEQVMLLWR